MKKFIIAALAFTPSFAFAQSLGNLETLLESVGRLVDMALPIVVALALLAFFYGLAKLIWGGAEAVAEGKTLMIWGVVALFVMVSVWGLVRFVGDAFGIDQGEDLDNVPSVPLR
jgi:hypothetical protein